MYKLSDLTLSGKSEEQDVKMQKGESLKKALEAIQPDLTENLDQIGNEDWFDLDRQIITCDLLDGSQMD